MARPLSQNGQPLCPEYGSVQVAATLLATWGPRKRWRDQVRQDLNAGRVPENQWYEDASNRAAWRDTYCRGLEDLHCQQQQSCARAQRQVLCQICGRNFRREGDKARHKCVSERQIPTWQQGGAVQCPTCNRWFSSQRGLTVHRCTPDPQTNTDRTTQQSSQQAERVQCQECQC